MSAFSKCVVCTDPETPTNPIYFCIKCEINVHMLCYGIDIDDCLDSWWCSPCNVGQCNPSCELCFKKGGALKKSSCGKWVHVICALFTEGVEFKDKAVMEPINISKIPEINRNKTCIFCSEAIGQCCKCNQPNCDKWLHITCGQKNNCLREINEKRNKLSFRAYCSEHKPVDETSRRISSTFVRDRLSGECLQLQMLQSYDDTLFGDINNLNNAANALGNASDSNELINQSTSKYVVENTNEANNDSDEAGGNASDQVDGNSSSNICLQFKQCQRKCQ